VSGYKKLDWRNVWSRQSWQESDKIRVDKDKQADSDRIRLESLLVATSLTFKGP